MPFCCCCCPFHTSTRLRTLLPIACVFFLTVFFFFLVRFFCSHQMTFGRPQFHQLESADEAFSQFILSFIYLFIILSALNVVVGSRACVLFVKRNRANSKWKKAIPLLDIMMVYGICVHFVWQSFCSRMRCVERHFNR